MSPTGVHIQSELPCLVQSHLDDSKYITWCLLGCIHGQYMISFTVYIQSYLCQSQCQVCLYPILSPSATMAGLFILNLISVSHSARSFYIQSYLCQSQCQVCLYSVFSLSITMPGLLISSLIFFWHNARSVYIQSYLCQSQGQVCFSTIYIHSSHEQCLISLPWNFNHVNFYYWCNCTRCGRILM